MAEKLTTIADNMQGVYDKGFDDGQSQGGSDERFTALWNGLTNNGTRTDCSYMFRHWKNAHDYWYPPYPLQGGTMMFYSFTSNLGLPEMCERAGVPPIDWSNVSSFNQNFSYASMPDAGIVDMTSANTTGSCFMYSYVQKVHIILKADGSQSHTGGMFTGATRLTDLTVEGAIGTSLTIPSPLNPESMISVITHLVNYAGTEKESSYKISFTDACWDALEKHSAAPDGGTWKDYVVYTLGWNV